MHPEHPSALDDAALARAAEAGWRVAVRADFDPAELRHVTALLNGISRAMTWRMTWADLQRSLPIPSPLAELPPTPWDETLRPLGLDSSTSTG